MGIKPENFVRNLPHLPLGVRLHINYFLARITGKYKKLKYCVAFQSIEDGIRGLKLSKGLGIGIPVPDEIKEECGVAILSDEEHLKELLSKVKELKLIGVFKREEGGFRKVDL